MVWNLQFKQDIESSTLKLKQKFHLTPSKLIKQPQMAILD